MLLVTFALVPLTMLLGLVVDLGYMHFLKESAQTAADSAVLAAVSSFQSTVSGSSFNCGSNGVVCQSATTCNPLPNNYLKSGCLYAQKNGFTSSGNQQVTLEAGVSSSPPTTPGMNTAGYWVTARVSQSVPLLFASIGGNRSGMVMARATAAMAPSKDCIWVMDPSASSAVSMSGTPSLVSSCGVYINSDNANALHGNGTPTLQASDITVVGGYNFGGTLSPNPPATGAAQKKDPLAHLPAPSVPSKCDYTDISLKKGNIDLYPGTYCGGLYIQNATVTFHPGDYILLGGGFRTQSANSTAIGSGVFFYNTFDSGHAYGPIDIKANSNVTLSAPTTGTYAGILFFEDRNIDTSAGHPSDNYGGGSSAAYTGTIYAPLADITMYGNASVTAYTIIVCNTLSMVGNTSINNDYSSLPAGSPIKTLALVE